MRGRRSLGRGRSKRLAARTQDSTSRVRGRAVRHLAAAELVPPRLILGGVEQPKRRRRALDRGGGKKASCQLPNPNRRGAAEPPSAVENRTLGRKETAERGSRLGQKPGENCHRDTA